MSSKVADSEAAAPALDVPALTAVLDGRYAQVRDLVRENLAEHASILDDAGLVAPTNGTAFDADSALAVARGLDPDAPRGLSKVTHTL